jgi:hypothetical protein
VHSLTCGRAANKDVILGEDGDTSNSDTAPRNDFSLTSVARQTLKPVSPAPTRAIAHGQQNRAIHRSSRFPEPPFGAAISLDR